MRKPAFLHMQKQRPRSAAAVQLISTFVLATSIVPLLSKSEILSLYPSSVAKRPSLCRTWSKTLKTVFLTTRLKSSLAFKS